MLRSPLPQTCAPLGGSSSPWTASIPPAWGGSICPGWSTVFPPRSSSPGKCWEDGLPSHHAPNCLFTWPVLLGPLCHSYGSKMGMKNSSPSLKRKHPLLCSDRVPLGCFGVPARYRRVAGSLLTVSWWWAQTRAESPSLSQNLPAPVAGQHCIHLGGPACPRRKGGNTARSYQFLHMYSLLAPVQPGCSQG